MVVMHDLPQMQEAASGSATGAHAETSLRQTGTVLWHLSWKKPLHFDRALHCCANLQLPSVAAFGSDLGQRSR